MPFGFGPYPGPRQIPSAGRRNEHNSPLRSVAKLVFDTEEKFLLPLLSPGFTLSPDPWVAIEVQHLQQVDWLAGRDYSTWGVKIPVVFHGRSGEVEGDFLTVLWENLADPILSGREELGYAKLWSDIEESSSASGKKFTASWLGHTFAEMEITGLQQCPRVAAPGRPTLHYKYIPRTGCPGKADAAYATMTPAENPSLVVEQQFIGSGSARFHHSTWQQLPTLFHIVNALASIPLGKLRSASLTLSRGGKDLSDVRILEAK